MQQLDGYCAKICTLSFIFEHFGKHWTVKHCISLSILSISIFQKTLQQVFKSYLENGSGDLGRDFSHYGLLHFKFISH